VYGYRLAGAVVEFVHLNATATERRAPIPTPTLSPGEADAIGVRPVSFETGTWIETPIYRRGAVGAGSSIPGPAVIEEVDSTTIVLPGQVARAHVSGALFIEHEASRGNRVGEAQELSRA
jgi:N-methylhydantoinase A